MKLLLICESTYIKESGGRVVRYITKLLNNENIQIKILVVSKPRDDYEFDSFYKDNDVIFLPIPLKFWYRMINIFLLTKENIFFKNLLINYRPDVVHFASFDHTKPSKFISLSNRYGAKVILQPWTMHFYCAQGFGFRNNKLCIECAKSGFFKALKYKCISWKNLPSQIERFFLRSRALRDSTILSSNIDLDKILNIYGINSSKIKRFPIPFDCDFLEIPKDNSTSEYFIYYGQVNSHKGINVLLNVFDNLTNLNLKIFPLSNFNLTTFNKNIEIHNGISWNNGLKDAVINAKVVIFPSLWSSSTEYALCEALLLKKPVIVFNVGVHKHLFINRYNAMVIQPGDYEGFSNAVIELNENQFLRETIGENGYNTIRNINKPNILSKEILSIYNE